jgi:hypothetical protein
VLALGAIAVATPPAARAAGAHSSAAHDRVGAGAASNPTPVGTATAAPSQTVRPTVGVSTTLPASATATASATAAFPTPPARKVSSVVHRTNGYQVGTYYFSGWSHGQNDNLTPLLAQGPLRKYEPLIGWYDDSQSQVDKEIGEAVSAGIDFFAFDWYDIARSPYATDRTLNEGLAYFLSSKQRYRLNFCLTFIDQKPFYPHASDWPKLVSTWIALFKQRDYVRVAGKPLFIVFSPENMRSIFGSSKNVRTALNYLRAQAVKAHLPGVTVAVGATLVPHYNPGRIGQLLSEGYDVTTGYNYHAMGGEQYRKPVPYKDLVQENEQMWDRVARNIPLPYIPVITSGWDQRFSQREQKTAIIYAGRTASAFACYASAARRWVDANAARTVKERIIMVFAWNEIGEGGSIIPNKVDRTAYVDALHRVLAGRTAPSC